MARVPNQCHGIAGEAKDDLKDHEGGVETNSDCEGGSEVRRGLSTDGLWFKSFTADIFTVESEHSRCQQRKSRIPGFLFCEPHVGTGIA